MAASNCASLRLNHLTLSLTQRCNLECTYCRQPGAGADMERSTLLRALDFFQPHLSPGASVGFYGGEPLLAFNHLRTAVEKIRINETGCETPVSFFLTTNGTLLTPRIADFLNRHGFTVLLSWDGPLQKSQRGAEKEVASALAELQSRSRIHLETNTVITPQSVQHLSETVASIHNSGIQALHITPDRSTAWAKEELKELEIQLQAVNKWMADLPRGIGLPVVSLRPRTAHGPFPCPAGEDRLALSPLGEIWGCYRFHDFFDDSRPHLLRNRYSMGNLDTFVSRFPDSLHSGRQRYSRLRPAYFSTSHGICQNCREVDACSVCPVPFGEGVVGHISETNCRIEQIMNRRRSENHSLENGGKNLRKPPCG